MFLNYIYNRGQKGSGGHKTLGQMTKLDMDGREIRCIAMSVF